MIILWNKLNGGSGGGGGDIGTGDYNVKVIDYDGIVIAEKNLNERESFTLPKAPSHDGLVFQEWSATQEIVNGKITIGKSDVMIGAIYTTASGQNEFDIEVTTVTGLSVTLNIDGTKDWGDGSTPDTLTSHTYSQAGKYTIKCDGTSMTTNASNGLFGQSSSGRNYYCVGVRFATVIDLTTYALAFCSSLRTLTLSNKIRYLRDFSVGYCYSLSNIILPLSVITVAGAFPYSSMKNVVLNYGLTTIGASMFSTNYTLNKIVLPDTISSINAYAFSSCRSLEKINISSLISSLGYVFSDCVCLYKMKFPKSVMTFTQSLFNNCFGIIEYDFTEHTEVPTLQNVNNFNGINPICKIKVPSALYDEWIEEANWVTFADYIVAV